MSINPLWSLKALLLFNALLALPLPLRALDDTVSVQILGINDFHGAILQTDSLNHRPIGGAAVLAALLEKREATNPATLMLYAGDLVGGSQPVSALLQDEPTIEISSFIGFDAGVPGNHEFDEGIKELLRLSRGGSHPATGYFTGAPWPLVLANVIDSSTGVPVLPPYIIKTVEGIPIAIIGIITLETPSCVTTEGIRGLQFTDPVAAVNKYAAFVRQKGVETIIVLAHEGGTQNADGIIDGPIAVIARQIDETVDVIISGHTHTMLNGAIGNKLIVQAGCKGAAFADIDLKISRVSGDVVAKRAELVTTWTDSVEPENRILGLIAPIVEKARPLLDRKITETAVEFIGAKIDTGESALGDLVADAHRQAAKVQIAFVNSGGIRRNLPAGPVTWGVLYEAQPFGNNLLQFRLTGNQIRRIFNQQLRTGKILQLSGMRYTWDVLKPDSEKISNIRLDDGNPLQQNKSYTVAANSFLAGGGDGFTVFREKAGAKVVMNELDALIKYLEALPQPVTGGREGRQDYKAVAVALASTFNLANTMLR